VPLTEAYNTPHTADRIRNVISGLTTVELPACLDPLTQAVRLRLEAENPDYLLRPDMFVDVDLPITLPPAIAVPVEAVLDSGREKIVFVERGTGIFEARVVRTGRRFGRRVEIVDGLIPGERIAVSGAFLLKSESRMRPTPARLESAR
jgi:Cu(I)/Ag(I) efflux system membrane fusion protein